ncbi:Very-long-chain 3-oxoacyl-CoA 1 [Cyphellophora attinorum]|uniref:Very-long-chain 3-oxoacyl-CoA 1 n=1 Tax=Cyphellophora attinorum TaxID=1664694 RepID=A0A0N1HLV1_9EURO|nr:Very-long-chain 3-oxoacyl-CoA 1 [Phialophora attinorum]KPI35603.1 Very-long-chain 3-oxoacyl-CoA 1 [Phialophora attinorum]
MQFNSENIFQWIGILTILVFSFQFLSFLNYHLRPSRLSKYLKQDGQASWAVVTGGGGGIGYGFSRELCLQGFNVIIIGHLRDELEEARTQLSKLNPSAEIKLIVLDATTATYNATQKAITSILSLNITILVNNVGGVGAIFKEHFKDLKRYTGPEIDSVLYMNNRFLTYLTRLLLPTLIRSQPSTIINLSSGAWLGSPYQVLYGASKAYVNAFSRGLDIELRAEGHRDLQVMAIVLGNVRSKSNVVDTSWSVPLADDMARYALQKVGRGRSICVPYWRHGVLIWVLESLLPKFVAETVLTGVYTDLKKMYLEKGASVKEE